MKTKTPNALLRLRKHADYQRVYTSSRKQFSKQMTFFFSVRPADRRSETAGPRVGLTVGKVMGKAVDRNRIKRRMRECIRHQLGLLQGPIDVILHPRKNVLEMEFDKLEQEVATVFRTIQKIADRDRRAAVVVPVSATGSAGV
jgi:ribonuclease P protein component